ncbi:MAG: hypothetical protein ACR2H1_14285 [Limisphaerales bacterium]
MKNEKKSDGEKSLIHRVDSLIEKASVQVASKIRRRSFLGRLTSGVIVVGGAGLILKPSEAQASGACGYTECRGTYDVNICYSPWKVVAAEPGMYGINGLPGIALRKGPSFSAPVVTRSDGVTPNVLEVGHHFGRQSNRSSSGTGCPDPGPRLSQNGFLWGYAPGISSPRNGWWPYSVGGTTYAVGDDSYTGWMCGPAADWDCRYGGKSNCPSYNGCGGNQVSGETCSTSFRPIITVGTDISEEKYLLRYAVESTPFGWLVPGDKIKRYGYMSSWKGEGWSCIRVICAKWAPYDCRGWVKSNALGNPISPDPSPCSAQVSIACPS